MNSLFDVSAEVADALADGRPVVALESTVISHGMPFPRNVETALALEVIVRASGAVPATITVVDRRIKVGLSATDLDRVASGREPVAKLSRRDLAIGVARGGVGATTVAATLFVAAAVGIRVFATGGIGGVHRRAQATFDISADIEELARSSAAVVCAGAKAILDLGLTLEALETRGVPVLGYRTDRFPAFYCRTSEFGIDTRVESARDVARICRTKWDLGLAGAVVVANPVPEAHAMDASVVNSAIDAALAESESRRVTGKALTPFLLARVTELTGGQSLEANVALIRNNAALAAEVATALCM